MSDATIIYPHQLFADSPAVCDGRPIYVVEEPLLLTYNPIHRQKLILHKLTLDAYEAQLTDAGHTVIRLTIHDHPTTEAVFARLAADGITELHIVDTTDTYLEAAISASGIKRVWYDSPLFIVPKDEAMERYRKSKRYMASFYKQLRQDKQILIEDNGKPTGGKWSFDDENRKKLPKNIAIPADITHDENADIHAAIAWAETVSTEQYGEAGCWLPYTHDDATAFLTDFLHERFTQFGPYEDAISTDAVRIFHSALSPLLNIGLLTPQAVLDTVLHYAATHDVPINSLEGFVRQILGWREFIRASYECDGSTMRTSNFFNHTKSLPPALWDATTGIPPLDHTINTARAYGYTHHIERLMVAGNYLLLTQTHPDEVYRWFMGMYVDAYDWVMVPNVYGMSQFADGGSFATKPYISGSNYIRKMSNHPKGDWEETWTALYWHFIATHHEVFTQNHRMSMMPRLLANMDAAKRQRYTDIATTWLS